MACEVPTNRIKLLAKSFPNETVDGINNSVSLWREDNNKGPDDYPTAAELNKYLKLKRDKEERLQKSKDIIDNFNKTPAIQVSSIDTLRRVDLTFDPATRRDRVTLIATLFSVAVDDELKTNIANLEKRIAETNNALTKLLLNEDLTKLKGDNGRIELFRQHSPRYFFNKVLLNNFNNFLSLNEEELIQNELGRINEKLIAADAFDAYTEEEKMKAAKEKAAYRKLEYEKIVKYFLPLAEETSHILRATEGIILDPNVIEPGKINMTSDDPEGNNTQEEIESESTPEERIKDGWMTNFREVSAMDSLSQRVRAFIRKVPKLDYEGYEEEDDLGNKRYLDADYVHAVLLDKLRNMIDADDLVPLLEELAENKPWITQILEELDKDESLFSQFYQDMRKDFTQYWIQKKKERPDGSYTVETIPLNKPEGVYYLLDSWRDNYENGNILDKDSVYNKNRELLKGNGKIGYNLVLTLNNKFNNKTTLESLELLNDSAIWNDIVKLLHMIGIDPNPSILRLALTNIKEAPGIEFTDPIVILLLQLNIIYKNIAEDNIETETDEYGETVRKDLINNFGSVYNSIAMMLAEVTEDAIESNVREKDKSYYAHTNPNYLGKLIKKLKNVNPNKKLSEEDRAKGYTSYFDKVIKEEFLQYDWFYKDGNWLSDWVEKLATNEKYRNMLDHKVVLNHDKIDYSDWDSLDYTIVLLQEFNSDPNKETAWYYVPILSDAPSAEFIRFERIKDGDELDAQGKKMTFLEIIIDKMVNLVNQEYNRIQLVRARSKNPNILKLDNYDIKGDKKGGSEFKFLPALNSYMVEEKWEEEASDGKNSSKKYTPFLTRLELMKNGSATGEEIKNFIKEVLRDVIETEFEETYSKWVDMGLLEELPDGKYKHFPYNGMSINNKFVILAMKDALKLLGTRWTDKMDDLLIRLNNNLAIDDRYAEAVFHRIKEELSELLLNKAISEVDVLKIVNNLKITNKAKDFLREYFYNSKHATSLIIELTTTDLAFYKNMEDFQKRYKEVHAPSLRLNTNSKYGRKWERTVYLKDAKLHSPNLQDIIDILDLKVKEEVLSKPSRDAIIKAFKDINWADAQAYRSMSSYRAIMDMSGLWTEAMDRAYQRILNNEWNMEDFSILWLTKKPYVYTQINNESGIEGYTGIKTPVQHKNSEFLLLAGRAIVAAALGKSDKLRAIDDFMENHDIDVIQFESTVKVGGLGKVDLTGIENYKGVIDKLESETGLDKDSRGNPSFVHEISYEDYGIQTPTPEHCIDHYQLIGTLIRKLITADISDDPNFRVNINGRNYTKSALIKLYNAINTENIIEKFLEIDEIFKDPKKVEKILQEEIRSNQRYGLDLLRACTLDNNGLFQIPLYDPILSQRVLQLINSVIKSRVTKLKIRGGSLIQVSSYGLSDSLKIVYEDYVDKETGEKKKRIKYFECYMPAYSEKFFKHLMTKDPNGEGYYLDVDKLHPDLRKAVGYRVPTEDKYSMAPLYIKGFLPKLNGSSIMLPAEITTISGSDFDIDKMYVMFPEFTILEYDYNKAKYYYLREKQALESFKEGANRYRSNNANGSFDLAILSISNNDARLNEWIRTTIDNGDPYGLKLPKAIIRKVKYDQSKLPQELSREARNNMLIDIMWGILTHEDTASKILNPGGFDPQKKTARVVACLLGFTEALLKKKLTDNGIKLDKKIKKNVRGREELVNAPIASYLFNLPLDSKDSLSLNKLVDELKGSIDPLSPLTLIYFHQLNMTGAHLIGIYANHNANHALMLQTELALTDDASFMLNGKRLTNLHNIMNGNGDYISRLNAGFLAASVDNVKDPVLAYLNQNTFTANASMLLSRLGYDSLEIGLLMNQPIVKDITEAYFKEKRSGKSKNTIIDEVIKKYKDKAGITQDLSYTSYKNEEFLIEDLAENIILSNNLSNNPRNSSDFRQVEYHGKQVAIGILFKKILKSSDALEDLVQATRADTNNGAAGPTIADSIIKIQKLQDFWELYLNKKDFPLAGCDILFDTEFDTEKESIDKIRLDILNSKLPMLQAFYSLGLKSTKQIFSKYFPHYTLGFNRVIDTIRELTKLGKLDVKTMNSIYNDLVAYIMSSTKFFGDDERLTSELKRNKLINDFPEYFRRVVESNEKIAELEFIKRLRQQKKNKNNPIDTIIFKNVGSLSPTLRERYMRDWVTLLYMGEEAQNLALNMFLYSYYRNGFAFGPSTFIHLAPVALRLAIPDYISTLRDIPSNAEASVYTEFIDLYFLNHLDNRKIVHELSNESTFKFKTEKGDILDEITILLSELSSAADKKIILSEIELPDKSKQYIPANYIAFKSGRNFIYYRLTSSDGNTFTYTRVMPLGYKNSFLEYEFGKNAFEIKSAIKENDKDYDPTADFASRSEPEIDYDSMPDRNDAYEGYNPYDEAFNRQYGSHLSNAPLNLEDAPINMNDILPQQDYTDANNDPLCGSAPTLATF